MDPRWTFTLTLSALHTLTYFVLWASYSWALRAGVAKGRQAANGKAPPARLMRRAVRELITAQVGFALMQYAVVYPLWVARGGQMAMELPSLGQVVGHLVAFILLQDTIFYWSHRTLHTPWLFRKVHYLHHRFVYVRAPVAEFAHPVEGILNFVAFFAGPVLLASPLGLLSLWVVLRVFETVDAHSGYALTPWASRHAFHHLRASGGCYGSFLSPWDRIVGTDRQWRLWRARSRPGSGGGGD